LLGFIILVFSGEYLVRGGVCLAKDLKISKLVIGMTIVAFGTSAPELSVSAIAAFKGHADIAIGNVIGSNITNIALVLAVTAIIFPISVNRQAIKFDWLVMMGASGLLYFFIIDSVLNLVEGLIFISLLLIYVVFSIRASRKVYVEGEEEEKFNYPMWLALMLIVLASAGLAFGSTLLIDGASKIALKQGVSERVASITLIAFGTSLPELTTSMTAAFHKESDISIGNIIGSNIFNILGVLGVSSIISDIQITELTSTFDIFWMLAISMLLLLIVLFLRDGKTRRSQGSILFVLYWIYIYLLF
jgi:cation:H+ antiporter